MATMSARYTVIDGEVIAQERGGVRHQLVPDPLGSVVALYNGSGTKSDTFEYWPYGESAARTGTTVAKFQYVGILGYYQDSVNRSYVRTRNLDLVRGKWFEEDPKKFHEGVNFYLYCDNSPVSYMDPSGLAKWMQLPPKGLIWYYEHAYIHFDVPCLLPGGKTSDIGFYPGGSFLGGPGHVIAPDQHAGEGAAIHAMPNANFDIALCNCIRRFLRASKWDKATTHYEGGWIPPYSILPDLAEPFGGEGNYYVCGSWVASMWGCALRATHTRVRFGYDSDWGIGETSPVFGRVR